MPPYGGSGVAGKARRTNVRPPRVVRTTPAPRPDVVSQRYGATPNRVAQQRAARQRAAEAARRQRIARAQQRQYVSQARAVRRAARQQRVAARARAQERQYVSQGRAVERAANAMGSVEQRRAAAIRSYMPTLRARQREATAKRLVEMAPVITVLEQTLRPVHGVAAGTRAAIKGQNVPAAIGRGVTLKDRSLFSDVLKDLGVRGPAATVGGLALDVLADPLTYVSGGTSSIARSAAAKAARNATRRAKRAGLTDAQAKRFGERAYRQTRRRMEARGRGASVRFAGRDVPGVTRATALAARGARAAGARVPGVNRAASAAKHMAADFNPAIAPEGMTAREYAQVRMATRTARSSSSRDVFLARQRAGAIQRALSKDPDNYRRVVDAIESGTVRQLPEDLRRVAVELRSQFRYMRRAEKRLGIRGATRQNYVPHIRAREMLEDEEGIGVSSVGAMQVRPLSSKARQDQRTLAQIRAAEPAKYVEDPGVLYAARAQESARSRAQAELNRRLSDMGRRVRAGERLSLRPNEAVYHHKGSDLRRLDPKRDAGELVRVVTQGSAGRGGRYVVLNEQAVERALKRTFGAGARSATGEVIDRVQGAWKFAATQPNPGFHLRNLVGDTQNAYIAQAGRRLPRNVAQAGRVLAAVGREERANAGVGRTQRTTAKGFRSPRYGQVTYDQAARELTRAGAIRSGFQSRELQDLLEGRGSVKTGQRAQALRRWLNNREDLLRASTALDAVKRGKTWEEAAAHASRFHFDYSDLTELERKVMRRIMPFWTFSARNIPLQLRSVITRPGKFAQYEKVRQELARAFGYEDNWEENLPEREQRAAPFPVEISGKRFTISLGPSGLPLTDLNEMPVPRGSTLRTVNKTVDEWLQRAASLVTPAIKTPVELHANLSFFFRDEIERASGPLVPVSHVWVKALGWSPKMRRDLGFVPDYVDRRTGKKGWAAPGKIVYALNVLPGPAGFVQRVTTPSERPGQSTLGKTVAYAGVRAVEVDPISVRIERMYEERDRVNKAKATLNQRGVYADNATPAYRRLLEREKDLTSHIMALRTQRGDKINRGRRRSSSSSSSGAGGIKWSDQGGGVKWLD